MSITHITPELWRLENDYGGISLIFVCTWSTNMFGAERTPDHWKLSLANSESHKKDKKCLGWFCWRKLLNSRDIDFTSDKPTLYWNYYMLRFQVRSKRIMIGFEKVYNPVWEKVVEIYGRKGGGGGGGCQC